MIISVVGALVGRVSKMDIHPNGDLIWLAEVDVNDGKLPSQIVYGGDRKLEVGDFVPVALPGARLTVLDRLSSTVQTRQLRARNYRGQRSNGMLCSLDELGWIWGGPNEVARLRGLQPGFNLDKLPRDRRSSVVRDWGYARMCANGTPPTANDTSQAVAPMVILGRAGRKAVGALPTG